MKRGLKKAAAALCALMVLSGCGATDTGSISSSSSSKMSEEEAMLVPPAMDEIFSYISVKNSDGTDDDGNRYVSYEGFEDSEELFGTVEEYIGILNDFGYTQSDYKESGSCFYTYFLDYSDDSMAEITKRDVSCQLAIEAMSSDEYGWQTVEVYYSPDIVGEYIGTPQPKTPEDATEEETEKATEKAESNLPPALDDVFSYVYVSKTNLYDDFGNEYVKYDGCENTAQLVETIESYIELLKDYGYTQTEYLEVSSISTYYFLDYVDDSLPEMTFKNVTFQMGLGGFSSDTYGWQSIEVYYSPDLMDYYRPAGSGGDDGGGSGGGYYDSGGSGSKKSGVTVPCSKCHGEKEITCTNCDGKGYKVKYVSTPNYSGHSKTSTEVRETCMKCHGTQKITCTKCGGSGVQ